MAIRIGENASLPEAWVYSHNLSDALVLRLETDPYETQALIEAHCGHWWEPYASEAGDRHGAVLLGGEWWAHYFSTPPDRDDPDPYPDFLLFGDACLAFPDRYGTERVSPA